MCGRGTNWSRPPEEAELERRPAGILLENSAGFSTLNLSARMISKPPENEKMGHFDIQSHRRAPPVSVGAGFSALALLVVACP